MSSFAKRVALDAGVLIAAFQPKSSPPSALEARAQAFVADLAKSGSEIILPTISLSEVLDGFPPGPKRNDFEVWIYANVQLVPYDVAAARMMADKYPQAAWKTAVRPGMYPRQCAKADAMIVATAVSAKADVLYSEDPDVHNLARGRISVETIPPLAPLGPLFPVT